MHFAHNIVGWIWDQLESGGGGSGNSELREDSSFELREDGSIELRE